MRKLKQHEFNSFTFTLSPKKWVEKAEAIGIISKGGRCGGEFAYTDIVFEFASWIFA